MYSFIQTSKYLLRSGTKQNILDFKTKLWQMRSAGLEKGAEFSIENIIYKELRKRQLIDKLNQKLDELT